ncbi:hypothetical protein OROGR_004443 [Orobanche gracilis]
MFLWMQAQPSVNATPVDPEIVRFELGLVDVFLGLCRLEWQAGYHELATALFQAEIDTVCFVPWLLLSKVSEDYLSTFGVVMVPESEKMEQLDGQHVQLKKVVGQVGLNHYLKLKNLIYQKDVVVEEEFDVGSGEKDVEKKHDVESMLMALGIDAGAEDDIKIKDKKTWTKWSKAEIVRDFDQWMPLRAKSDRVLRDDATSDAEDDEQLLSIILYEDRI